jgi:hypothetical protein
MPNRQRSYMPSSHIFVFFNSFAINMVLQYKKVDAGKIISMENGLHHLELIAKTALAWQIFAGTLAPI